MFKKAITDALLVAGYSLHPADKNYPFGSDMESDFRESYRRNKKYTMTSINRMYGMYKASEYVIDNGIEGAFVECGVWRGGSVMVGMDVLLKKNVTDREFWLYDTFAGMSKPTEKDVMSSGLDANQEWQRLKTGVKEEASDWCFAGIEEVIENVTRTGYPRSQIITVQGKVEETIPDKMPEKIALLRLDTDWYESTRQELEYLFPRLSVGGVLILDDYGCWKGAREAVDEYFLKNNYKIFFQRLDYSGRMAVKTQN